MDLVLDVVVDGGVDDALALAVLVGSGALIHQAVATEGSLSAEAAAAVTARLLRLLGCDAPVRLGASSGLSGTYPGGRDPFHGVDGFGGAAATLPVVEGPTARWASLERDVFASGALTVPALALAKGSPIERLWWMGGAIACGGNMTAAAEFNAWMDPAACDAVLRSEAIVSIVPLDVTTRIRFGRPEVQQIAGLGAIGEALAAAMLPIAAPIASATATSSKWRESATRLVGGCPCFSTPTTSQRITTGCGRPVCASWNRPATSPTARWRCLRTSTGTDGTSSKVETDGSQSAADLGR